MEQHSSNTNSMYLKEDFIKYLASHIEHSEQCVEMLKNYLPLLPEGHYDTIQKLDLMASLCINNSREALNNINRLYAKNDKQKLN